MHNLFSPPDSKCISSIEQVLATIAKVFPVPKNHKRDLPFAVRDLSSLLTEKRSGLGRSYWSAPRLLSAYLYYFLPWNLFRQAWFLPSLNFDFLDKKNSKIFDLGSGPLTLPLALWCSRPDLRNVPITFICSDVAVQPMNLGRDILKKVMGKSPWNIEITRNSLDKALSGSNTVDCIMAANVLNELPAPKEAPMEDRVNEIIELCTRKLSTNGMLLFIEPGTRLGAKMISLARNEGLQQGLSIEAPCTHTNPCPMYENNYYSSPSINSWCHFVCPVKDAPSKLTRLATQARLEKQSLAISLLVMKKDKESEATNQDFFDNEYKNFYDEMLEDDLFEEKSTLLSSSNQKELDLIVQPLWTRVISNIIRLPEEKEPARYGCSAKGLVLIRNAVKVPSGGASEVVWGETEQRDKKTGALFVNRVGKNKREEKSTVNTEGIASTSEQKKFTKNKQITQSKDRSEIKRKEHQSKKELKKK